jgi:GNAT superfamily N-acetyltransferase
MQNTYSRPVIVCRPALPKDTVDVKAFCKFTWDGGRDYVLYAWDGWLADPEGILAVAEYAGRAVGLVKLSLLAPEQWWLEGFRVDREFQGQKIGSHLHRYINEWWLAYGDGTARLITHSHRVKVHHLCEKLGYTRTAEVAGFIASPLSEQMDAFQLVKKSEISKALRFTRATPTLAFNRGLLDLGWCFVTPNTESIQVLVEEKLAWWWHGREGLLFAWKDEGEYPEDSRIFAIGLPTCKMNALSNLLLDTRRLAAQVGFELVFWIAPQADEIAPVLKKAGFERKWENTGYIYEKRHPSRP